MRLEEIGEILLTEGGGSLVTSSVPERLPRCQNCHQPPSTACQAHNDKGGAEPALHSLLHQCPADLPHPLDTIDRTPTIDLHSTPPQTHATIHSCTSAQARTHVWVRGKGDITGDLSSLITSYTTTLCVSLNPEPTWDDDLSQADVVVRQEVAAQQVTGLRVLVDHVTSLHNKVDDALGHVIR